MFNIGYNIIHSSLRFFRFMLFILRVHIYEKLFLRYQKIRENQLMVPIAKNCMIIAALIHRWCLDLTILRNGKSCEIFILNRLHFFAFEITNEFEIVITIALIAAFRVLTIMFTAMRFGSAFVDVLTMTITESIIERIVKTITACAFILNPLSKKWCQIFTCGILMTLMDSKKDLLVF